MTLLWLPLAFGGLTAKEYTHSYTLVVTGFDWGPGANKVILPMDETVDSVDRGNYRVEVTRKTDVRELNPGEAKGTLQVLHAYVSDEDGHPLSEGAFVSLVLAVSPNDPLSSPMKYMTNPGRGNYWIDYSLMVRELHTGKVFTNETRRIRPIVDAFDLTGVYTHPDGTRLTYASYVPEVGLEGAPLIIWLHGGGEGGTDPSIVLMANRAANYASDEIQTIFQGAYVLVPQTSTRWMHGVSGGLTQGQEDDIYHKALIGLFDQFIEKHPNIDPDRIYVGGCSNGGYMSLKLLIENPDTFAAAFISALAYQSRYLTDTQLEKLKDQSIWFVHSADDRTTVASQTVIPVYERLQVAGAKDVHLSLYDHVVDVTGLFGGSGYLYNGHLSWIYHHANLCRLDYDGTPVMVDGRPVTIMEWVAAQRLE